MPNDKEIHQYLEALFNFKSSLYSKHFQNEFQKIQGLSLASVKKEEALVRAVLDTASRFIIDLYDVIDHSTRETLKEADIPLFWKNSKKIIEHKMDTWIQESAKNSPELTSVATKLRSDIREFQERAAKFHQERQTYSHTIRKTKNAGPESENP